MAKHKHQKSTIEINGKIYDPHTGREVSGANHSKPAAKSIDGVVGNVPIQNQQVIKPTAKPQQPPAPTPTQSAVSRPTPKHAKRQTSKSQTLMRSGLKKPASKPKPQSQSKPTDNPLLQDSLAKRAERAKQIQKNRLVQRFPQNQSHQPQPSVNRKNQPLEVAQPKQNHNHTHQTHQKTTNQTHQSSKTNSIKDFERAIQNATSHLEKMPKRSKKSRLKPKANKKNIVMASIAAVLLMGFFAWQNAPNLQMRLAASRANIPAGLPGYSPAGYSTSDINSEPGKVSVSFSSRADERAYTLVEEASGWNDEALYANYVEPREGQTYESSDKKIYLIDNSNATWVENGIWYRIEGSSELTTDQISRIANSL